MQSEISMLLDIEPYQEFKNIDDYREFFQPFLASRINAVQMMVDDEPAWVQICDPDYDIDLSRILNDDRFKDVKWHIAPVRRTNDRLNQTNHRNYRFSIHSDIVDRYRIDMMNGAFFPLLAFDAKRQFWPSGQHRLEAATGKFDAHFSVVFEDLTEEQVTIIYEMTNLHHSNGYSKQERINLFHDVASIEGVSDKDAMRRLGLKVNSYSPVELHLAVKLVRKHPDLIHSWSRESDGGWKVSGRVKELAAIGFQVNRMGGEKAINELEMMDWVPVLNSGIAGCPACGERSGHRKACPEAGSKGPDTEGLTPKQRVVEYLAFVERAKIQKSLKKSGITSHEFDEGRILDVARYIITTKREELIKLRELLDEEQREQLARAAYKFNRIFGQED